MYATHMRNLCNECYAYVDINDELFEYAFDEIIFFRTDFYTSTGLIF